jgi:ATP-binding cassette subfamily B protein
MSKDIGFLAWPLSQLGEGIQELAHKAGISAKNQKGIAASSLNKLTLSDLNRWIEWAADQIGLEAEAIETPISQYEDLLISAAPALLQINIDNEPKFLLLLGCKFGQLQLIAPNLSIYKCSIDKLRNVICETYEAPIHTETDSLLALAEIPHHQRDHVKTLMARERLANQRIRNCWLLRLPPTAGFWQQLSEIHLPRRVLILIGVFMVLYAMEIGGWSLIGQAALNGRLDYGWFSAWFLLMLTLIPLHLLGGWLDAIFALDLGRLLKKRLLAGALRIDLQTIKHQGAGQFLGRVMESQALESLALNGGFAVLIAGIELIFAGGVLAFGVSSKLHLLLLAAWFLLTLALIWRYFQRLRKWTFQRLDMTHDLVERMVGHRTRLTQESPLRRDVEEDQALQTYFAMSKEMDDAITPIVGAISRTWLIAGLVGLAPAFISGIGNSTGLAISLGGILLANRAFTGIANGLSALARAWIAWTQVSALFHSADKKPSTEPFFTTEQLAETDNKDKATKLIDASNLVFRYQPQGEPVLRGVNFSLYKGERILLEGASGGGKSTLASLLVGLRIPDSGLLLINGLDRHTLGEGWHQLATEAPQFHENHILSGTLAFNLLMGKNWPALESEIQEARNLCIDLGLGELLERMPSGMMQMVGETGWQLSHGERSRIYLARALLQNAQLMILDESFAALDPESLEKCLNCAFGRANTLIVIAHP